MKKFCLVLLCFYLSGCFSIGKEVAYNKNMTNATANSDPIYLSFRDNKNASFYFILERPSVLSDQCLLRVRWNSPDKDVIFNGFQSTLRFLIDNAKVVALKPIKLPRIVALKLDERGHTEEAMFYLSLDDVRAMAYAKSVEVELAGKYMIVSGYFNKFHTFKAFKNFVAE